MHTSHQLQEWGGSQTNKERLLRRGKWLVAPRQQLLQGAYGTNPGTFASTDCCSFCTLSGQWKAHRGKGLTTGMVAVVRIAAQCPFDLQSCFRQTHIHLGASHLPWENCHPTSHPNLNQPSQLHKPRAAAAVCEEQRCVTQKVQAISHLFFVKARASHWTPAAPDRLCATQHL